MSTIFISHSSRDNLLASELGERLAQQNHHSVFLDFDPEQGIVAGQSWEQTLYRKLRACRAVIVLCTDHYLSSQWCFAEIALARMEGKHIVALQMDPLSKDAKLPSILTDRQFIDLRTNSEEGYRRLWKGLKEQDLLGVVGEWDPKKPPYLGLSAYQEEHAPVFFGREDESRAGLELLSRGAPGLIMVLGSSGSGKSSLVRAGMLPRLRREEGQWLVVDPFRPGMDPYIELAESLVQTWRRYAPEHAARVGNAEKVCARLESWTPPSSRDAVSSAPPPGSSDADAVPAPGADQRVARLIQHIEELREDPPAPLQDGLRHFLEWSLDDLQRITGEPVTSTVTAASSETTPLVELALELQRDSGQRNACVLLVVDQFEENLGHEGADHKANRFLGLLRASLEADHSPLMAVGTMRSDFLGVFQRNAALRGIDFESLSLGPMRLDGMRRVIEEPAKLSALELETGLADRLIADTETPDALPLLSFTLSVLWRDCREDGKLQVSEYEQLGGLNGAIAGEADALLALTRNEGKEEALRTAFLRMARLTEEGSYARQPVAWDAEELRPVHPILKRFVERRLLVTREEGGTRVVGVAHEALFRSWTPLKAWLDNNRAELLLLQQIKRDARAWQERKRAQDSLWRGGRLQQAQELVRRVKLPESERAFVRAAVRRRQLQWLTVAGLAMVVIIALSALWLNALTAQKEAEKSHARTHLHDGIRFFQQGWPHQALAHLAAAARFDPEDSVVRSWLLDVLTATPIALEHDDAVRSAAFSPNGRWVVTASFDKTAQVWDAQTGARIGMPMEHEESVRSAAFSRDGTRVVTASFGNTAQVWAAATGKRFGEPLKHGSWVTSAAFSPDGTRVITASVDKTAQVWDVETGAKIGVPLEHEGAVTSAMFSPDGRQVVTASRDNTAQVWNAETGAEVDTLRHPGEVWSAAFGPDGHRVLTVSSDETVRLWVGAQVETELTPRKPSGAVTSAAFSPDGRWVVAVSKDNKARVWNVETGAEIGVPLEHKDAITFAAFSPDGRQVVTTSEDHTAQVWDVETGTKVGAPLQHAEEVLFASFSPDGRRVVTTSEDHTARVWNNAKIGTPPWYAAEVESATFSLSGRLLLTERWMTAPDNIGNVEQREGNQAETRPLKTAQLGDALAGAEINMSLKTVQLWDALTGAEIHVPLEPGDWPAAFSPDGHRVMTVSKDKHSTAQVRDVKTGSEIGVLLEAEHAIMSGAFSRNGRRVMTASRDETAQVWDAETGVRIGAPLRHAHKGWPVALSPDGHQVITATEDNKARVWNVETGAEIGVPLEHKDAITFAAFSRNGRRVVTTSEDHTAQVWDVETGAKVSAPLQHAEEVLFASFSPDGRRVVTTSEDHTARVWDVETDAKVGAPLQHAEEVLFASFSPDGRRVVTTSEDHTAQVWDVETGARIGVPLQHTDAVESAVFHPDGRRLLTVSADEMAWVWDVLTAESEDAGLLADLAEAVARYTVNDRGNVVRWPEADKKLKDWRKPETRRKGGEQETRAFVRWYFGDPLTRTVSPLSEVTPQEIVRRFPEQAMLWFSGRPQRRPAYYPRSLPYLDEERINIAVSEALNETTDTMENILKIL